MSLGVKPEIENAAGTGNAANVANSATARPSGAAESKLRSRWSAELIAQTRQSVAENPMAEELLDFSSSESFFEGSSRALPDGRIQSGASSIQEQETIAEKGSDGSAPPFTASPASVSERGFNRSPANSTASASRPTEVTSERGLSKRFPTVKSNLLNHKDGMPQPAHHWKIANQYSAPVLPVSTLQVSPPEAVRGLQHALVAATTSTDAASRGAEKSSIQDQTPFASGGMQNPIQISHEEESVAIDVPTTISGLHSSLNAEDETESRSFPVQESSGAVISGSTAFDKANGFAAGIFGIASNTSPHSATGTVNNAQSSQEEYSRTVAGYARETVDPVMGVRADMASDGVSVPRPLLHGSLGSDSRSVVTRAVDTSATSPISPSTDLGVSDNQRFDSESIDSDRILNVAAEASRKLKNADQSASSKAVIRTSIIQGQQPSASSGSTLMPHGFGAPSAIRDGVLSAELAGSGASLSMLGVSLSGNRPATGSAGEPDGDPFQVLDLSTAQNGISELNGSQLGSSGASRRTSSLGGPDGVRALEVGYEDPTLGYVELRAHAEGGGIHASLAAQSADSNATLEAHLSSLAGWMNERRTPVESLTVSSLSPEHFGTSGQSGDAQGNLQGHTRENDQAGSSREPYRDSGLSGKATSSSAPPSPATGHSRTFGLTAGSSEDSRWEPLQGGGSISVLA